MDQERINLLIGRKVVTKEEILDIYQNMWNSPRGVLWFYNKYGPGTLSYYEATGIAYPIISYGWDGEPVFTKTDYSWAQALFRQAEPPVPYDEETKRFLADLFPPRPDYSALIAENRKTEEYKQRFAKFKEIVDSLENNSSTRINMDTIEVTLSKAE